MDPSLSIIVPVYNTASFLRDCIESVLSQSFTDFELILVDDGSTDGSGALCDSYAEKEERIRVFHKENGGVSSARNKGLDVAKGEFVVFLDADDYITNHHFEHLMSFDADLISTGIQKFGAKNGSSLPKEFSFFRVEDLPSHWNTPPLMNYLYCYPVAKRFRSRIIQENKIRFNESLFFSEDMCFNMSYYSCANSFAELPYPDYMYRIESIDRNEKYMMSASQLICHFEYLEGCFQRLNERVGSASLSFVRDDTCLRLIRKFYFYLMQNSLTMGGFVGNIKEFRRKEWAKYMLSLLQGKREKRVMNEAVRFPFFTYCVEVRLREMLHF